MRKPPVETALVPCNGDNPRSIESGPGLERARAYAAASRSDATRRAYTREWEAFAAWCGVQGLSALPTAPTSLAVYLAGLADGTIGTRARRPAGIELALVAVANAHKAAGLRSPREAPEVRAVRAGIRRTLGVAQRKAAPLLIPEIKRAVELLPASTMGQRDRALLLVGWAGGFRRSALVALDLDDLDFTSEGVAATVRRDKTDQEGKGRLVAIPFGSTAEVCPVRALSTWIDTAKIVENGPVFRRIGRHGSVLEGRLSGHSVDLIVKRVVTSIGGDPAAFSGHSLRRGFCTAAARAGRTDRDIARQTGHRSMAVLAGYIEEAELWRDNPAMGLL